MGTGFDLVRPDRGETNRIRVLSTEEHPQQTQAPRPLVLDEVYGLSVQGLPAPVFLLLL
jgi:hypothetical protein